jgi:hypothetical protein
MTPLEVKKLDELRKAVTTAEDWWLSEVRALLLNDPDCPYRKAAVGIVEAEQAARHHAVADAYLWADDHEAPQLPSAWGRRSRSERGGWGRMD